MKNTTRGAAVTATLIAPLLLATPALASGGPGGSGGSGGSHGGGWTCGPTTTQTLPGITTQQKFAVLDAGTAVLERDSAADRLVVGAVTANAGWSRSVSVAVGPKVSVQWTKDRSKVELEAAQSAQYYGPDVLVTEIRTCTR